MRSLPIFGLLAVLMLSAAPAAAQSRADITNLNDRLSRLEAQVYQSGGGSPQTEAQLSLRIGQLEEQVRVLTGQAQEAVFKAQQLEEQLRRFQEDTEFRFRELQGGGIAPIPDNTPLTGTPPAATPAPGLPQTATGGQPIETPGLDRDRGVSTATEMPMDGSGATAGLSGLGAPPQTLGTLSLDGAAGAGLAPENTDDGLSGRPLDLSALSAGGGAVAPQPGAGQDLALMVPNDPRAEFELGYSLIIARDYPGAETVFRQFVSQFPASGLIPDAKYWIGESLFQRGQYRDAADTYLGLYTEHGESEQAAPGLLRLAQSLDQLGERDAACSTLGELQSKYANGAPNVIERARQERQRWGC